MNQQNDLNSSKLSLVLVVVFILSAGIVTGLNISRTLPVRETQAAAPVTSLNSPLPANVLSISTTNAVATESNYLK